MTDPTTWPGHDNGHRDRGLRRGLRAKTNTATGALLVAATAAPLAVAAAYNGAAGASPSATPAASPMRGLSRTDASRRQAHRRHAVASRGTHRSSAVRRSVRSARSPVGPHVVTVGPTYHGAASWYGPGFHGRTTANGERYDMYGLTAAHRTLPFGTRLRVCRGQRCVVVRINDRGPYAGNRILDLSRGAAERIGLVSSGVAQVAATVVDVR